MTAPPPPPLPAQGPGSAASKNALGTWSLILGIVSILCCGFLAGVPAIILGIFSKKAGEEGLATNANLGQVGLILGIVGSVLWIIGGILNFLLDLALFTAF